MKHPPTTPPSLGRLFLAFVYIALISFGGALAAWIRREIVQRRGWIDDKQFLSGYALSQLIPGATNPNLAVFIGSLLRGGPGALVAVAGLTVPPVLLVLVLGTVYLRLQGTPAGAGLAVALTGMGAVAIGLNLGLGIRLARRNIRRLTPALVTAVITISIGLFGFKLLHVLLVMMPVSLLLAWLQGPEAGR